MSYNLRKRVTTETFGISCELAIIKCFNGIEIPNLISRSDNNIIDILLPKFKKFFEEKKINKLEYVGLKQNKVDFIDNNNITFSVKSNLTKSNKICPQIIGQCTLNKFNQNIYSKISDKSNILNNTDKVKQFILNYPNELFLLYFESLFCCDNIIYIKQTNNNAFDEQKNPDKYLISLYKTNNIIKLVNDKCKDDVFDFTRKINWVESSTLKVLINNKYLSIGEFQIHNNRDCIKFRFNMNNLLKYLSYKEIEFVF